VAKGADCKSAAVWLRRFESFFPHHFENVSFFSFSRYEKGAPAIQKIRRGNAEGNPDQKSKIPSRLAAALATMGNYTAMAKSPGC
jgi:hypothetical protein